MGFRIARAPHNRSAGNGLRCLWLACLLASPVRAQSSLQGSPAPDPAATVASAMPELHAALADAEPRLPLQVTLFSSEQLEGHPHAVTADTLWLVPTDSYDEHGAPPPPGALRRIPLSDIAQVKQWRSGAETGARRIGIAGAFIGAGLGLAVGGYAAEYDDGDDFGVDDSHIEYYVIGAMMGATIFGMAGLVTGAGVGAMVHGWYPLHPGRIEQPAPAPEVVVEDPTFSRLLVEAGWSTSAGDAFETSGLGLAAGLLGRPAPTLEMGPVLRYHALDERVDAAPADGGATFTMIQPVGTISLDLRCQSASAGWRPWIDGGLGWSLANDLYPSVHLGVGLRLRVDAAHDYGVSVRRHMALRHLDDGIENYWTVGAIFGFTL